MLFYSAKINGIHMMQQYGMALRNMHCVQPPEPKQNLVSLAGGNGKVDMTNFLTGYPLYDNRLITMEFGAGNRIIKWPAVYSEILNLFHNQEVQVIFDDDTGYFYRGRARVSSYERTRTLGILTIEVDADPYKYEITSALDDWLWDPFDLDDGIIREYKDILVSGTKTVSVIGSEMPVIPVIICSAAMSLTVNGVSYPLSAGTNKVYGAVIMDQEYDFVFDGTGTVSIDYRGGSL